MALHSQIEYLSVWEISHRWQDYDPDESDPKKPPQPVRERIRQLLQALTSAMNPYDVHGEDIPVSEVWFTRIRPTKFARTLERHLHQGTYDNAFLTSVFLFQGEFEKWCWRANEDLPAFWFPDQVNQWGPVKQDDPASDTKPKPKSAAAPVIESRTISTVAKKAAQKRHEPLNQLKQAFVVFYGQGKFQSRADAARQFYGSLPKDKQRLILKDNAARTLTAALPKLLRSKDRG